MRFTTEQMKEHAKINLGKGIKVKRFRRMPINENINVILLALLYADDIKLSELAAYMDVNIRSVEGWVYKSVKPKKNKLNKLCDLFNVDIDTLFPDKSYYCPDIPKGELDRDKFTFRRPVKPVIRKILFGLMYVYNLTPIMIAKYLGYYDASLINRWIVNDSSVTIENRWKLEKFFHLPPYILFKKFDNKPKEIIEQFYKLH